MRFDTQPYLVVEKEIKDKQEMSQTLPKKKPMDSRDSLPTIGMKCISEISKNKNQTAVQLESSS